MLGQREAADLLQDTLDEEKAADESLTEIAEAILGGEATEFDDEGLQSDEDEAEANSVEK
jgi:hypothetical protein